MGPGRQHAIVLVLVFLVATMTTLLTSASHLRLLSHSACCLARNPTRGAALLSVLPPSSPLRAFCPRARPSRAACPAYSTQAMADSADADSNPLLADFDFPPFDRVEPAHVRPGIRALLARLEGELEELEKGVEPAWERLVHPLERIVDRLDVVWNVVDHLKAVKDSADLRAAVEDVQPEKVKFYLRLGQSKPIYEAFNAIRNSSDWDSLSDARKRVVEGQIKDAVLGGVALEDEQREKFNQIQQELEKLSEKFSKNVLDATTKFEKLITDKKEIDGLPASALGLAAQTAVSKGHENASAENGPWMITLDAPSFMAVMQHAKNRALREEVYRAYLTRASSGDLDNTDIISQILKLRLEKAKLLGYKNFAEVSMARKMATVDRVQELLEKIRAASWDHAVQDMEDLKAFVKDSGSAEANDLAHWDLNFWSERLRESTYDIDEEGLRPYFALPKVMDGLFSLANKLFGITVEAADGLAPVWNSDVKFYCVKDSSNSPVAYFYFDPYSRPSEKRGGAWMNVVFSRSSVLARHGSSVRLPVAHMVCNQMPPVGDKPSLMTFREVETVFHEFGHALQHMLTRQDEAFVAGISGIEWDAVELPSQFRENLCYHKNTLLSIAKHYETGEPLPEEIYAKLVAAKNFRAGTFSLRQIRFASVDMELHTTYDPSGAVSVYDVDRRIAEKTQVLAPLPEDRFLCGFSHIFAGGCAAGYYSYKVVRQFKRPLDVSEKEIDAAGDGDVLVILDLRADQSLIEAGVAREVVNRIRRNPLRSCRQASALSSSTLERESFCPAGVQAKPTVPRARATGHQYLQSGTGASAKPSPKVRTKRPAKMGDSSVEVTEESQPNARVGTEFTGVRRQASGRYTAHAKDERGRQKHLGTFDTKEQAVKARKDFVLKLELKVKKQLKKRKKKHPRNGILKEKEKACIALEQKRVVSAQENSSAAEGSTAESPEEEKRPLQKGDVISALAQKSTHVPYRNSKLTQVLKSSLGGQAKTLMFVQINPNVESYSESISTLKFAERVSGVELGAAGSNKDGKDIKELLEQVSSLKDTISRKDMVIEELQLRKDKNKSPSSVVDNHGSSMPKNDAGQTSPSNIVAMGLDEADYEDNVSEDGSLVRKTKYTIGRRNIMNCDIIDDTKMHRVLSRIDRSTQTKARSQQSPDQNQGVQF